MAAILYFLGVFCVNRFTKSASIEVIVVSAVFSCAWVLEGINVMIMKAKTNNLYNFNNKFLPNWQERYLVFEKKRFLPNYIFAIAKAEL